MRQCSEVPPPSSPRRTPPAGLCHAFVAEATSSKAGYMRYPFKVLLDPLGGVRTQ